MESEGQITILLVLDTVRKDHLSLYEYDRATTPELDRVADEAMVYSNALSQSGWTLPSHASMFTGKYLSEHGACEAHPYLDPEHETVAETLRANSVATGCFTSNPWISSYTRLANGFETSDNYVRHVMDMFPDHPLVERPVGVIWRQLQSRPQLYKPLISKLYTIWNYLASGEDEEVEGGIPPRERSKTPQILESGKSFLEEHRGERFLFMNFMDAHLPYRPPQEFKAEFTDEEIVIDDICKYVHQYNTGVTKIDEQGWDDIKDLYDASIRYLDSQLGSFFDWLKEVGLWEDSTIIITSDHGQLHNEHDLYGHDFGLYEPLINVPLLIKPPGSRDGDCNEIVELRELHTTILDAHGISTYELTTERPVPNRSLLRPLEDTLLTAGISERGRPERSVGLMREAADEAGVTFDDEARFNGRSRAVRTKSAKLVQMEQITHTFDRINPQSCSDKELSKNDLDEKDAETLETQLSEFIKSTGGWGEGDSTDSVPEMGDEMQERLKDLGYIS